MLYDPRGGVWSLEGFVRWLEGERPERGYDYRDPRGCLVGEYLRAKGQYRPLDGDELKAMGWWGVVGPRPWTYRAALGRARRLYADGAWKHMRERRDG